MLWLLFATISRLFWSGTDFTEQYLSRAHGGKNTLAPLALMLLCDLPLALIAFMMAGGITASPHTIFLSATGTIAVFLGLALYLYALRHESAHDAVPYLEMTPVFVILFALLLKHQYLSGQQTLGIALILIAGFLFSWNFREGHFKFSLFAILALASFLFALFQYALAEAETQSSAWTVTAIYFCGRFLAGGALLTASKTIRADIVTTLRATRGKTALSALTASACSFLGLITVLAAFARAPSYGHVAALSGLQSVFTFLLAIPLGIYWPNHFERVRFDREQYCKLMLIFVICAGVWLLARA